MAEGVQRASEAVRLQAAEKTGLRQYGAGYKTPEGPGGSVIKGDRYGSLLQSLLGAAGKAAHQRIDRANAEAYLKGANDVNVVASEDQLETNILTRNFTVAGFRDTTQKFKMAQKDAELQANMPKYAELTPEAFAEILGEQRAELLNGIAEMSYEQRVAMAGKLIVRDQAAMQQHASERAKWIVQTEAASIAAGIQPVMHQLEATRSTGDHAAYSAAVSRWQAQIEADIWQSPNLPTEMKQKLTQEALNLALASDDVGAYQAAAQVEMHDGKTMLQRLPMDAQVALAGKYREAMNRTSGLRNMQQKQSYTELRHALDNGTFEGSGDQALQLFEHLRLSDAITDSEFEQGHRAVLNYREKQDTKADVMHAALNGSAAGLAQFDVTPKKAADSIWADGVKSGEPLVATYEKLATMGANGLTEGYSKLGQVLAPAIRSMANPDGTLSTEHYESVQYALNKVRQLEADGNSAGAMDLLAAMPESDRIRFQRFAAQLGDLSSTGNPDAALNQVLQLEKEDRASDTSGMTARQKRTFDNAVSKLNGESQMGFLSYIGNKIKFLSADAAARVKGKPLDKWFDEPLFAADPAFLSQQRSWSLEVQESMRRLAGTYSFNGDSDALYSAAMQDVASRAVNTDYGVLYLPAGQSTAGFLGNDPDLAWAGPDQVGEALTELVKLKGGDVPRGMVNSSLTVSPSTGELFLQGFNKAGDAVMNTTVSKADIRVQLRRKAEAVSAKRAELYGNGSKVQDGSSGNALLVQGSNTAGVQARPAIAIRTNLIRNEGIRNKVYRDTQGVLTMGVGVSEKNTHWPKGLKEGDVVTPEVMQATFEAASNDAMQEATGVLTRYNLQESAPAITLAAEMAYQSGKGGISDKSAQRLFEGIRIGNRIGALQALKETNAWKFSGKKRRLHYAKLVEANFVK